MMLFLILLVVVGVVFVGAMVMVVRNEIVFRAQISILNDSEWDGENHVQYDRLPSYDAMLWDFSKWTPSQWRREVGL